MPHLFDELRYQGLFSDLDTHFADFIQTLAGGESHELRLAASLVSRAVGNGNVCININALGGTPIADEETEAAIVLPDADTWVAELRRCPVVGKPDDFQPLILDKQGRLYLFRYWQYEQMLAQDLKRRALGLVQNIDLERLKQGLEKLFPAIPSDAGPDWQKIAAAAAVLKGLCVISGGPGTGKTTTVTRILALLADQGAGQTLAIGLAAPTGKAAARMQEAIRSAKQLLNLSEEQRSAIPEEALTIHRLLGALPDSMDFRHNAANPLPLDVVVIDEASMVDLALMTKLVQALPARARLILLGDKDQLASVEAGSVLGDICAGDIQFSDSFRARLQTVTGEPIASGDNVQSPLRDSIILLRQSYRFGTSSGIGALARAVNQGQGEEVTALLGRGGFADIAWHSPPENFPAAVAESIVAGYRDYLNAVRSGADPETVFAMFNRFRVLCALRRGPFGVVELNQLIERALHDQRLVYARQTWYLGRPVIITRNDYNLRLFNGDVGVTLAEPFAEDRVRVVFQTSDGGFRRFPPARLPEHETVYAMTVHKSQGSEFDKVLMIVPFDGAHRLTRELLYTAVTRARQSVEIWANDRVLKTIVNRGSRRSSGLRDALWGAPQTEAHKPRP